ncbi:hypothetical protein BYT27DRAFT_7243768 [Phlegmacium glaucopus]|nr:hypothetical protein BYT27DRAFT_7243768 [Phlegmacium glaucopus]
MISPLLASCSGMGGELVRKGQSILAPIHLVNRDKSIWGEDYTEFKIKTLVLTLVWAFGIQRPILLTDPNNPNQMPLLVHKYAGYFGGVFQRFLGDVKRLLPEEQILPVFGRLPLIFGLNIATYILCELTVKPILDTSPYQEQEKKLYKRPYLDLLDRKSKIPAHQRVLYLKLPRHRSLLPPRDVPTRPTLARWDPARPLCLENCVIFDQRRKAHKNLLESNWFFSHHSKRALSIIQMFNNNKAKKHEEDLGW